MKKTLITILLFNALISFGQRYEKQIGYLGTDSIIFNVDGTTQSTAFTTDTVGQQILDSLAVLTVDSLTVNHIDFATDQTANIFENGRLIYNSILDNLVFRNSRENTSLDIGREGGPRGYNGTGSTILNGGVVILSGNINDVRTIACANAKWDSTANGVIAFATEDIAAGDTGEVRQWGEMNSIADTNASGYDGIETIYLDTVDCQYRITPLTTPFWNVSLGAAAKLNDSVVDINIQMNVTSKITGVTNIFNGAIYESHTIQAYSDGSNSFLILKNTNPWLTLFFSSSPSIFTIPDTVQLTSGSDASPTRNYVYIPQSTKALTVSTVGFPSSGQYVPVADIMVQSAFDANINGLYKVHAWTDHLFDAQGMGHLSHINFWIRNQYAGYIDGLVLTSSIGTNGAGRDTIKQAYSSGEGLQLHTHNIPAFDLQGSDTALIINDEVTAYTKITNAGDITTDTQGNSLLSNNTYWSFVNWIVISEDSADCQWMINKPAGSYTSTAGAITDINSSSVYSIPKEYKGVGILTSRVTVRYQTAGSGTFTIVDVQDLRDLTPATAASAAGGDGGNTEFVDNTFEVSAVGDVTSKFKVDVGGVTPGNTSTLIIPDISDTILVTADTLKYVPWRRSSNDIYYNEGTVEVNDSNLFVSDGAGTGVFVGIGTKTQADTKTRFTVCSPGSNSNVRIETDNANAAAGIQLHSANNIWEIIQASSSLSGILGIRNSASGNYDYTFSTNGNLGVGYGLHVPLTRIHTEDPQSSTDITAKSGLLISNSNATVGNYSPITFGQSSTDATLGAVIAGEHKRRVAGEEATAISFSPMAQGSLVQDALYIDTSGYVGIGIVNPASMLSVGGVGLPRAAIMGTALGVASIFDIGVRGLGTNYCIFGSSPDSAIGVYGGTNTGIGGYFTSTSGRGLIVANGNAGIGNLTPAYKLDVTGKGNFTDTVKAPVFEANGKVLIPLSIGTVDQIPYMKAGGTDFDYTSDFTYDGITLSIIANASEANPLELTAYSSNRDEGININRANTANAIRIGSVNSGSSLGGSYIYLDNTASYGTYSDIDTFINIDDRATFTSGENHTKILVVDIDGVERIRFNPRVPITGDTAYILDTDESLTTSAIMTIRNKGDDIVTVTPDTTFVNNVLKTDSYTFTAAKTYYKAVHGADIVPGNPYTDNVNYNNDIINCGADNIYFNIPIDLPHNAIVTAVIVYGNAGATAETYTMYRMNHAGTGANIIVTANIGTEDVTPDASYDNIDNEDYLYVIKTTTLDTGDGIYGARITYTMTDL